MSYLRKFGKILILISFSFWLTACGGNSGSDGPPPPSVSMVGKWNVEIENRWTSVSFPIEIITQDKRGYFEGTADSQDATGYPFIVTGVVSGTEEGIDILNVMTFGYGPSITCSEWTWLGTTYDVWPYTRYYELSFGMETRLLYITDPNYIEGQGFYYEDCDRSGWTDYYLHRI